jgi:hypothetical protein
MLEELQRRQQLQGSAQSWFHKYEEQTDDDLRSLLEDQDLLDKE